MSLVSRYLTQKSQIRISDSTVKFNAFMPPPTGRLSVYLVSGIPESEIWEIGDVHVGNALGRPILGRADLQLAPISECGLTIEPAPHPHPRHANIVGWPNETETRLVALKLASHAVLKMIPK